MNQSMNLTQELARLLNFTSTVAIAIRMYSAYNQSGQRHENAPNDLMFLSDSLHNFDQLGHAILEGRPANIAAACDSLLTAYRRYQFEDPRFGLHQGKWTFDRNAERVSLAEAVDIFNDIRAKVLPMLEVKRTDVSEETKNAILSNFTTHINLKNMPLNPFDEK